MNEAQLWADFYRYWLAPYFNNDSLYTTGSVVEGLGQTSACPVPVLVIRYEDLLTNKTVCYIYIYIYHTYHIILYYLVFTYFIYYTILYSYGMSGNICSYITLS